LKLGRTKVKPRRFTIASQKEGRVMSSMSGLTKAAVQAVRIIISGESSDASCNPQ
jgi:hypothetical protein